MSKLSLSEREKILKNKEEALLKKEKYINAVIQHFHNYDIDITKIFQNGKELIGENGDGVEPEISENDIVDENELNENDIVDDENDIIDDEKELNELEEQVMELSNQKKEKPTVASLLTGNSDLSTLVSLLQDVKLLDDIINSSNVTLLAPPNDAFSKIKDTLKTLSTEQKVRVLLYHVIPVEALSGTVVGLKEVNTLAGEKIKINVNEKGEVILNGTSKVVVVDIEGRNGVIHLIDNVLIPPSFNKKKETEKFKDLMKEHVVKTVQLAVFTIVKDNKNKSDEFTKELLNNKNKWLDGIKDLTGDEELVKRWDSIFWSDKDGTPGHSVLVKQAIDLFAQNKKDDAIDIIKNGLVKENLPLLIEFWVDVYNVVNKNDISNGDIEVLIEQAWSDHLICTEDYLVELYNNGLKTGFERKFKNCVKQGIDLGVLLDGFKPNKN